MLSCSKAASYESVDVSTFAEVIQDSNTFLLDVRTESEYLQGHIEGAILIDVTQNNFLEEAKKQLPKDKTIALYCRSGRRSKVAAQLLADEGYKVVELNTGYNSWQAAMKQ